MCDDMSCDLTSTIACCSKVREYKLLQENMRTLTSKKIFPWGVHMVEDVPVMCSVINPKIGCDFIGVQIHSLSKW